MKKIKYLKRHINHLDLKQIKNINDLLQAFHGTSFQSRNLARCCDVFINMLQDKDVVIFMGLSGALVPGGMKKVIRDMIEYNLIDVLVSTGANLYHDFFEGLGYHHYLPHKRVSDAELGKCRIDRIYDTLADDVEFQKTDIVLSNIVAKLEGREYSSREFLAILGRKLEDENSILYTAGKKGTPIFCPAINDSSIGIALTHYYHKARNRSKRFRINQIRDNYEILQIRKKAKASGAVYIGGGVPKNYIQQLGPMLEVLRWGQSGHKYALQITTDDPKWGGLSGCTFEEAVSWRKVNKNAKKATVYMDATIGLPLVVGAILQNPSIIRKRKKRKFYWEREKLEGIKYE